MACTGASGGSVSHVLASMLDSGGLGALTQCTCLDGKQVEHFLPFLTQEQFMQRPLLLHEQHKDILPFQRSQKQSKESA